MTPSPFSRAPPGRPFSCYQVSLDVIRQGMGKDAVRMYDWFDRVCFAVDRTALRREFPDVAFHDFDSWAKTQDDVRDAYRQHELRHTRSKLVMRP